MPSSPRLARRALRRPIGSFILRSPLTAVLLMMGFSVIPSGAASALTAMLDKHQRAGPVLARPHHASAVDADLAQSQDLKIRNRTPFVVIIYVGDLRVGWLAPYRTGIIRGLKPGHHRLRAHSRWGTVSWGPRVMRIPGIWSLRT